MNGTASSSSNHSATASFRTEGAKGRNDSRRLILALRIVFMSARRGSHTIERFPSARGPHSIRPWNQPTTLPSAIVPAVRLQSSASSAMSSTAQPRRHDLRALRRKQRCDLLTAEAWTPIGMIHDEAALPSEPVPEGEGGTDGAARITRRRLHIDAPKGSRPPYLAIGNGVHRAPASQRDIGQTGTTLQRLDQIEKRLFVHGLDRPCDVPMAVEQGI